jgi:tetratricopeptide (TPR) repeat protein
VLYYAQRALDLSIKKHYLKGEFESRKWKPIILRTKADYPNALKSALENLHTAEQINDTLILLIGLQGVAKTYNEMNDFSSQLIYNRRSKEIINSGFFKTARDIKENSLYYYLNMMGAAFQDLNQNDSALYYLYEAYNSAKYLDNYQSQAIAAVSLAKIYLRLNKYDSAYHFYEETIVLTQKINTRFDLAAEAELGLAKVFYQKKRLDSSLHFGRLSLKTFQQERYPLGQLEAASFLDTIYLK